MKRIVIAAMSTLSAVVLVLLYPTSTNRPAHSVSAGGSGATGTTSGTTSGSSAGATTSGAASDTTSGTTTGAAAGTGTTDTSGTAATDPSATTTTPAAAAPAGPTGTFDGAEVNTRWGVVQVEIVVENGVITSADAIQHPTGERESEQINSFAVPQLNSEVVAAQSASIDMVSGATVTSRGYLTSLQDAIDQAFQ